MQVSIARRMVRPAYLQHNSIIFQRNLIGDVDLKRLVVGHSADQPAVDVDGGIFRRAGQVEHVAHADFGGIQFKLAPQIDKAGLGEQMAGPVGERGERFLVCLLKLR